eukprot:6863101-Pyramimonas_sp.AAC.1
MPVFFLAGGYASLARACAARWPAPCNLAARRIALASSMAPKSELTSQPVTSLRKADLHAVLDLTHVLACLF